MHAAFLALIWIAIVFVVILFALLMGVLTYVIVLIKRSGFSELFRRLGTKGRR